MTYTKEYKESMKKYINSLLKKENSIMSNTEILGKGFKEQLTEECESLSKWISASTDILNILENTKKSIGEISDLNEAMCNLNKVDSKATNNDLQISTYEIDIKRIADVSKWEEDGIKPIKLILSVSVSSKKNLEILNDVISMYEDHSSLYDMKFSIMGMALLMEDGTFRTIE